MVVIKVKAVAAELQITVAGFQLLVYEVPSTEESCSSTEDEDCPKAARRS